MRNNFKHNQRASLSISIIISVFNAIATKILYFNLFRCFNAL